MTETITSAVELVRRYGGPMSHAALDPSRAIFRAPGINGLIGFLVARRCAVVFGDPICAPEQKTALADAFETYCAGKGWTLLYASATAAMQAHARERGYASMEFAGLLIADPRHDPELEHRGHRLRQHLSHVRRTETRVREYLGGTAPDPGLEARAETACEHWLATRRGMQMHLGRPRLFEDKPGRRWFIAEQEGDVVGILSMLGINCFECRDLINIVFSSPAAPLYTNELLVIAALRALRQEGVGAVCLGVGPLAALGRIEGCGGITEFLARVLYRLSAKIMNLRGRTEFWEKYHVTRKEPLYLLFQSPRLGPRELNALFRALHFSVER